MSRPGTLARSGAVLLLIALFGLGVSAEHSPTPSGSPALAKATFAGGCFWCMQGPFDRLAGVVSTTAGYTGGETEHPTYEQVSAEGTGHAEAVQVVYDPRRITYAQLLEVFWRNIDPTVRDRQFCDVGPSYRTAIFSHDDEQKRLAEQSKVRLDASGQLPQPIVTEIVRATEFWPAEEAHQNYYRKNPLRYRYYRSRCGRDQRLEELWGAQSGGAATHE